MCIFLGFRPLPIGIDSFREIIEQGYYYIDKTAFIKELLDMKEKVNLFTRPRRFGKTLNLSMLQCFLKPGIAMPGSCLPGFLLWNRASGI